MHDRKKAIAFVPFIRFDTPVSRPKSVAQALLHLADVDIVTTDFDHQLKRKREKRQYSWARQIVYIDTLPYRTNNGMKRLISHIVFSIKAAWFFWRNHSRYDVVYVTAPLNLLAFLVFAIGRHHKKIVDIVDVWPDVLPFSELLRKVFFPVLWLWKRLFIKAVSRADILLAVSDAFLEKGTRYFSKEAANARRFYIGHQMLADDAVRGKDRLTIAYVGNIGHLYDFETLIAVLGDKDIINHVRLYVIGDGDRRGWFLDRLDENGIAYTYYGVVFEDARLASILRQCHIGFNGYLNTSASFSYKAVVYFSAGLPILNSMEGDLHDLVARYQLGYNYEGGDRHSLRSVLLQCDLESLETMSKNCETFFQQELDASMLQRQMVAFFNERL